MLKEANAAFPSHLTGRLAGIVSPTAVKAMGDEQFNKTPIGTGPFKNVVFQNDSFVRVEKFDGYWKQGEDGKPLPYLDKIEWRIISEPSARLTALQAGDVHIAPVRDQDLKIVKEDRNLAFGQKPGFSFGGFYLMRQNAPFDNKALRQAIQFALDREEIVKAIYEGNREVGQGPLPLPMEWAIDRSYKPYPSKADPEKAKARLAEGGRPNGFEFTYLGASGNEITRQLAELMQAQLAKVGIKMNIELADFNGVVIPRIEKGEGQAIGVSWNTGIDPDQIMSGVFGTGGAGNYFKFSDPRVDDLIKQGRQATSLEERGKAYKEIMPIIMDDAGYVFLTYGVERFTGSKKVQGWTLGPSLGTGYSDYWLDQ